MKITEMKEVTTSEWEQDHDRLYLQGKWVTFNRAIAYIEALEEALYDSEMDREGRYTTSSSKKEFITERLHPIRKKHIGDI